MSKDFSVSASTKITSIPFRISAAYMAMGGLWILLSDLILGTFISNQQTLMYVATAKGVLYAIVTGFVLYTLIRRGVSQIVHAEEMRCSTELRHRELIENANSIILRMDLEGNITFFNEFAQDFFGFREEDIVGGNVVGTIVPEMDSSGHDLREMIENICKHPERYKNNINENIRRNGDRVWIAWANKAVRSPDGDSVEILCVGNDVTERKLAETRLEQTNAYLENILENSPDPIGIVDEHGRFIKLNRVAVQLFGYSQEEASEKSSFDLYADAGEREKLLTDLRQNGVVRAYQVNMRRKDGTTFPVELSVSLLKNNSGKNIGSVAIARNLSEIKKANEMLRREIAQRQKAEGALRESENMYRTIFENTGTATVIIKDDTTILLANSEFERLLGYSKEEIEGKMSWTDYVTEPDLSRLKEYHMLRAMFTDAAPRKYEFQLTDRHGNIKTILATMGFIPGTQKMVSSYIDCTEQKKLEEELFKTRKLESVGVLAGGIAHDFNNILTAIMGNISLAKLYANPEDRLHGRLEEAERAAVRAKDLTYQLLTFSKGGAPVKKTTSIFDIVKESAAFALRGSNVRSNIEKDEKLWLADADAGQISQVVNNIVINAKQAMPAGGTLNISLRNVHLAEPFDMPLRPGKYIRISIRDQGTGIPEEHLQKIFDPYFSTKQSGSGLGLATSYSIISKHNGYIDVESEPGIGTTFHIYLPAAEKDLVITEKDKSESINGRGKILLMDDEKMLREMASQMLALLGYEAVSVKEGIEAVEIFKKARESDEPFDGVILDLTIPGGMGGVETIGKLREIDPSIKAVASSGYSNDPVMANFEQYGFRAVIAKPYMIEELGKVLREIVSVAA